MRLKLCLLGALSAFTLSVAFAQPGGGAPSGSFFGKVLDELSGKPVEFATITVFSARDSSMVTGGISNEKGKFDIDGVRPGGYMVHLSFIGYETTKLGPFQLNPRDGMRINLGEVSINPLVKALEAAEVVEKREFMELMMDKRIYNVGEALSATGGSATEVLETLPSIEVDVDGSVSLRGSENVNILIDGKPSALSGDRTTILEQIPASSIERIEVITNPSAKYDADGMTGIINIVLKKSKLSGFHGSVSATAGTGDQYNGSLALNYRTKNFNAYTNYGYRYSDRFNITRTDRTTFRDENDLILNQDQDGFRIRESHNIKSGIDLYLTEKSSLALSGTVSMGTSTEEDLLINDQYFADGTPLRIYEREGLSSGDNFGFDLTAGWRTEFEGNDHFITADVQFGQSDNNEINTITNTDVNTSGEPLNGIDLLERNVIPGFNETLTLQTDYSRPLHQGDGKLETGYKSIIRTIENGFFGEELDFENDVFEPQTARNNDFAFTEAVHAVYASYGRKIERFSFQGGLRAEQVYSQSNLITTNEVFNNDYFSLFPSAFLTYKVSDKSDFNVSYSRRINRPNSRQLNPFPSFRDELTIFRGNPFLLPEYINAYEAAYSLRTKRTMYMFSIYMQDQTDVVRRFNRVDENGVTNGTFENLDEMQSYGVEFVANTEINKWWSLNLSGNGYRRDNNGGNLQEGLSNVAYSWSMRGMSTMKFGEGWNIQLSGFYRAPEEFIQGRFSGFWYTDIAVKKSVLDNKGAVTLNLRDIFDTREFLFTIDDPGFVQSRYRKRQSQFLMLSFSYKFGKLESGKDRRGRGRGEDGGGGFDGIDMD